MTVRNRSFVQQPIPPMVFRPDFNRWGGSIMCPTYLRSTVIMVFPTSFFRSSLPMSLEKAGVSRHRLEALEAQRKPVSIRSVLDTARQVNGPAIKPF